MSLQVGKIISEQDFKYGLSDYAVNLREKYGENGYKKYVAKMNSIMVSQKDLTNPISASKEKYLQDKKEQYLAALANFKKADSVWSEYKPQYNINLNNAKLQNGGISLSGGQKQKLAIADALASNPGCLVLDEPTAMLDPASRKEVIKIAHELNQKEKMTIVLITHHTDEVVDADRIILMKEGKIVGDGIPEDIFGDIQLLQDVKMDIPPVVELGMRLKRRGIELDTPILREQDMIEAIDKLYRMKCGGSEDAER
mgnify:CR=1 FL=1